MFGKQNHAMYVMGIHKKPNEKLSSSLVAYVHVAANFNANCRNI